MSAPAGAAAPSAAGGTIELCLPAGWVELLPDPQRRGSSEAVRSHYLDLLRRAFPGADQSTVDTAVDALIGWRSTMLDRAIVSHGVVRCPRPAATGATEGSKWVEWNVLTSVVGVPRVSRELDLGEMLARLLDRGSAATEGYTETFATDLGCGVGLILQPSLPMPDGHSPGNPLEPPDAAAEAVPPGRYGLAAALSCRPGGGAGVLVCGVCLDPHQVLELAGVVAIIAGRSRFVPSISEIGQEP